MKHIFINTNVIIDFLADRKPFSEPSAMLFQLPLEKRIKIYVAAISFNSTYYILQQVTSHREAIDLISEWEGYVGLQETNRIILREALKSDFNDFEDAIQYYSAVCANKIEVIATRNTKDFKLSDIPVLTPETIVNLLLNED